MGRELLGRWEESSHLPTAEGGASGNLSSSGGTLLRRFPPPKRTSPKLPSCKLRSQLNLNLNLSPLLLSEAPYSQASPNCGEVWGSPLGGRGTFLLKGRLGHIMVNVLDCKSENGGSTPPPTFATQIKVHGSNQHAVSFCALPNLLRRGELGVGSWEFASP